MVVDRNIEHYGLGRFGPNYTSKYAVKYRQLVRMKKQYTTLTNRGKHIYQCMDRKYLHIFIMFVLNLLIKKIINIKGYKNLFQTFNEQEKNIINIFLGFK